MDGPTRAPGVRARLAVLSAASRDPRHLQIVVLTALLVYGLVALDFEQSVLGAATLVAVALATQALFVHVRGEAPFDPRSPLISALSLALLLRSNDLRWLSLSAFVAIASKFLIRHRGKHVFNPTNLAIVLIAFVAERAWVSPGQWGSAPIATAAFVLAGALVLGRARRSDITFAFLVLWSGVLFGRSLWLGEPVSIPVHRLQSGGLLLFAFFMLSDPRTIPDARAGRIAFAAVVAAVAGWIEFGLFRPHGVLIALAACAPLSPLIDRLWPAPRFHWTPGSARHRAVSSRSGSQAVPIPASLVRIPSPRRSR